MNELTIILIEWNCYNGFIFELIHMELFKPINIDRSLFGINISRDFFYINFLFMQLRIY